MADWQVKRVRDAFVDFFKVNDQSHDMNSCGLLPGRAAQRRFSVRPSNCDEYHWYRLEYSRILLSWLAPSRQFTPPHVTLPSEQCYGRGQSVRHNNVANAMAIAHSICNCCNMLRPLLPPLPGAKASNRLTRCLSVGDCRAWQVYAAGSRAAAGNGCVQPHRMYALDHLASCVLCTLNFLDREI